MNPFEVLSHVQNQYRTYVQTFQRFQNQRIEQWIGERITDGTLLWKPPYVQLSRPFAAGEAFDTLVAGGILHPRTPPVFRRDLDDPASLPHTPYRHQTDAVRRILDVPSPGGGGVGRGRNVIVATGTGSGKSFAFGIPIVSEALRMRDEGILGIKAVIIYPMNALANSQYDDFAARLHGSGLTIARYTGDTLTDPAAALEDYRRVTGRDAPYDSEVLSREEIQNRPPDILMTNYVMLELLLTRFEDRTLFRTPGVLRFLVLDEVHTYTGKRGADVAALIRRLKQHTGTVGHLRCIATSATVESTGEESATEAVANFAQKLFGEPFAAQDVITETYAPLPADLPPLIRDIVEALATGPKTVPQLAAELGATQEQVQSALIPATSNQLVPKLHAFFSQGRAIAACLRETHLNDRGDLVCPACADANHANVPTFPLVFCRACGQEYWSVAVDGENRLHPADLGAVDVPGRLGYILLGQDEIELPNTWRTPTGKVRGGKNGYRDVVPEPWWVCPDCGMLLDESQIQNPIATSQNRPCAHPEARPITFLPAPFLLCPACGIVHDRRSREYNKLFIFGSVGRSTATDVLVSAQVQALPEGANKVIAFSDNRQDTALQAAHMNSLHHRFTFRRTLWTALVENEHVLDTDGATLGKLGGLLFETQQRHHVTPRYRKSQRRFGRDRQAEDRYQDYLTFVALRELGGTHRRTHQNLEDVGLLQVGYYGLKACAEASGFWEDVPLIAELSVEVRYDLLLGLLDLMRKRLALRHPAILEPVKFRRDVIEQLSEEAHIHDDLFRGPIGYSDSAEQGRGYQAFRLTGTNTQPVMWVKRVFEAIDRPIEHGDAVTLVTQIVGKLGDPEAEFLVRHSVRGYGRRQRFELWMVNPDIITLNADESVEHWRCPKCGTVHRFKALRVCTGTTCRTTLERRDLTDNYFRQVYATPLGEAVPVQAEEHSGQVEGQERREIEVHFKDAGHPLNALICTPTMELGIDIGHLNAVTLRNVPPSPSNYAQRAGRAGRSGQASLVTVFAGVGSARGPHDQYFYRFPEKMIAGAIAAPRFRLDNQRLITAHIHALVLETLGLENAVKMPGVPQDLLDQESSNYPLYLDWRAAYEQGITRHFDTIVAAVQAAFAEEIAAFAWFDRAFVERTIRNFLLDLDRAMDRWRDEYARLDAERQSLNQQLGREGVDSSLDRRRIIVEAKLDAMRKGKRDWYLYRYLGGEGFLPGYAFPPEATTLSFDDREDELARDPVIALTEYAPGNFVYYRGQRYETTYARPRSRQAGDAGTPKVELDIVPVLVCPECERAYMGTDEVQRAQCECGADLTTHHPRAGMALTDMYARARARITADEEERLRLGYVRTEHYRAGGQRHDYEVRAGHERAIFRLVLEHNGEILLINQGQREREGDPQGFTLCRKCNQWLVGDKAVQDHISTPQGKGRCPRNATTADLERRLWLTHIIRSDLALIDAPLPDGADPDVFYTTLLHTLLRALMVAFNLDEREVSGFLAPPAEDGGTPYRIILYETSAGGSGVLDALNETGRMRALLARARELLHSDGDGCEKACYECLLSFFNQRVHDLLDRRLVLPWLQSLGDIDVVPRRDDGTAYALLTAQCQSDLERQVLHAIHTGGLPLPDQAQATLYDRDGAPIAIADFYYEKGRIVVFVDGSPHYLDYAQDADARKRRRLKALGYRVVVIEAATPEKGIGDLSNRLK